jgi:hypothetical protein
MTRSVYEDDALLVDSGRLSVTHKLLALTSGFASAAALVVIGLTAAGQAQSSAPASPGGSAVGSAPKTGYVPPRTPDGQPDLQGLYQWTPRDVPDDEEGGAPKSSRPLTPDGNPATGDGPEFWYENTYGADGKPVKLGRPRYATATPPPVYQPWAEAKRDYIRKHENKERRFIDPIVRCLRRGVPRTNTGPNAYASIQFLQTRGKVVLFYEWGHDYRVIRLDGRPHPGKQMTLWMGDSVGRWEGNTLVVDVTNFTDKTWIGMTSSGTFHSDALHVVERYTPVDKDQIFYEFTVDDPNVLQEPWHQSYVFTRAWEPGYAQLEYACHEGNRAVTNILDGAANLALPKDKRK